MVEYSFFETIVAGETPEELMMPYDSNITVDEYIVYNFKDAHKLKKEREKVYQKIIDSNISNGSTIYYQDELNALKNMSDEDAYYYLTSDYDLDENNYDIGLMRSNKSEIKKEIGTDIISYKHLLRALIKTNRKLIYKYVGNRSGKFFPITFEKNELEDIIAQTIQNYDN